MRYLITSALPYINGIKHLGNLAGSMLPADVHARFRRLQGHEVLFICATDEHGTPAELAAAEAGQDVAVYCAEQHEIQKEIYQNFALSFDYFGRSSSPQNKALTQHFCDALEQNGLIEERQSKQVYSVTDGRFLPDRYVEGTCPKCGFDRARGDQCDNCGTLLDPVQLINPRSKISGSTAIEIRDTTHLFLRQSKMEQRIRDWVNAATEWPALARSIAHKWLDEGLKDRSITRDLSWGVPVTKNGAPRAGFDNKVFYVWFDAPIEYIGATQEWAQVTGQNWQRWWRTDAGAEDVKYIQFMGKDNVAFHTVSFPITILGSAEPWKLVDRLKAFNWVTWYGGKFSTSEKRGIFMNHALELLPADYWRWYLMANAPEGSDAAFTWEGFQTTINSDLANVLGNFVNRIVKFTHAQFNGAVPTPGIAGPAETQLLKDVAEKLAIITQHHEQMDYRKAAAETRALWVIGNEYLASAAPWTLLKTDRQAAATATYYGLWLCVLFAYIAQPFMPTTTQKMLNIFGMHDQNLQWPDAATMQELLAMLPAGTALAAPEILFNKIEDEWIATQAARFGGAPN